MSFAKISSAQVTLLSAQIISVEVDLSKGLHAFSIVGLPDKAVEESKDRISAAIKNAGFKSPKHRNQKIIISLAPADLKKEGPVFDMAFAIAYLLAAKDISFEPQGKIFLGELSLDGQVRKIRGVLPITLEAKRQGFKEIFVPKENAEEAALVQGITVYGVEQLADVIRHINKKVPSAKPLNPQSETKIRTENELRYSIDFKEIRGQETAKRGLEIAAAGGHNIAMFGPPGTGKTMLAKAFCGLLPNLTFNDSLEVTSIQSIAGILKELLVLRPPFRSPHHTSSYASLVGGGTMPKPGEITLAHKGVLFLDEFAEFEKRVIDSLREPLEERIVSISRVKGTARFPANFILIVAMNPCPCGNFGIQGKECLCTPLTLSKYQRKISGSIVDRIDIWVEVSKVDHIALSSHSNEEETMSIKKRVLEARKGQTLRMEKHGLKKKLNSEVEGRELEQYAPLDTKVKNILNQSAQKLDLSARAYHRIWKIARTIADLEGAENINVPHILEAIQYRPKRNLFSSS